jgi:hypothetical protein
VPGTAGQRSLVGVVVLGLFRGAMDKRLDLGHFDLAVAIVVDCLEDAAVD